MLGGGAAGGLGGDGLEPGVGAVALDPENARALQALMATLFFRQELQESLRARRQSCTVEGLVGALDCLGLGVQPDYWPELQRQRLPTLLLTGALDDKFTQIARRMAADWLAGRLPAARPAR